MDKVKVRSAFAGSPGLALLIFAVVCAVFFPYEVFAEKAKSAPAKATPPITITSDTMHADRTARTVVFKGDVEAREDFLLCSDELYMNYTGSNEVEKIDARGHVRIFRDSGTARAQRAVYDRIKHVLILTGDAVVERCADTVKGDKISLYLDDDSVLVEGLDKGRVRAVIVPDKKCDDTEDKKGVVVNAKDSLCKQSR